MLRSFKIDKVFFSCFIPFTLPHSRTLCQPICCVYVWGAHPNAQTTLFEPKIFALRCSLFFKKFNFKLSANIPHSPWPCLSTALSFFLLPHACQVWRSCSIFRARQEINCLCSLSLIEWLVSVLFSWQSIFRRDVDWQQVYHFFYSQFHSKLQ